MISAFIKGSSHLLKGVGLIIKPELRRFVIIPLLINVLLFAGGIYFLLQTLDPYVTQLLSYLPEFLSWLSAVLWFIFSLLVVVIVFFVISMLGGLVAAPFNALLSEAVENHLTGKSLQQTQSTTALIKQTPGLLVDEVRKLIYFSVRAVPLLILFIIPVVNIAAPFIWFYFTSWILALNYLSFPMENHQIHFREQRSFASDNKALSLGYGSFVTLLTMIPLVNFIIIPASVAGATSLWVKEISDDKS
jgi:CysZ protein